MCQRSIFPFLRGLCLFLALLTLCLPAAAAGNPADAPGRTRLRAGYTETPGQLTRDQFGFYSGIAFEYISSVAAYMDTDLEFIAGSAEENLSRLQAGELDLVIADRPLTEAGLYSQSLGPSVGFAILRESDLELAGLLNQGVASLNAVVPFYRLHLLEKYAPPSVPPELTAEEKEYLKNKVELHAFTSEGQPPYTYFMNGQHEGVIAEIVRRIATDLQIEITIAPEQGTSGRREAMENGSIDLITDFYADFNWAAENNVIITIPYLTLNYVPVLRRDAPLPEKPLVACARGHFYNRSYVERTYPSEQIRYYDSIMDCLAAVNRGEADLAIVKALTAQQFIHDGAYFNLYTTGNVLFSHPVAMAVSKRADPRLVSILNKEIAHLSSTEIPTIITRASYAIREDESLLSKLYRDPLLALSVVGGVSLLIILVLLAFLIQRRHYNDRMYELAHTNSLTGMHNLRWLQSHLPELLERYQVLRSEGRLFLMALTADRIAFLKENYNEKILISSLLKEIKRIRAKHPWLLVDAVNSEVDCLYVVAAEPADKNMYQAAQQVARDAGSILIGSVPMNFTYHIGLVAIPAKGAIEAASLIANAQTALREASSGGNTIITYNEALSSRILRQQQMEDYMYKALENQEFKLWLQAKYNLKTHEVNGAEALVRWDSPELGFLMPGSFIGIFEQNGFIVDLDYYMLERTCELQSERIQRGLPTVPISVNQSGLHITEQGYIKRMKEVVNRWKLPPGLIELEITETAFIDFTTKEQREEAARIIDDLQETGFSLSMDDFCTGYSSLSMLQNLPMNVMKIDRSILVASETSQRSLRILRHVIELGKALGMKVLVEGIETERQESMLIALGCDSGQGFLFAQPTPARDFYEDFLPKHQM